MGIKVDLDFNAADALVVAILQETVDAYENDKESLDKHQKKFLKAMKRVIEWHSV